ncbi:MAG: SoxR reducing system RseC family protein [Prevotella sp.]|nr:SoxR reducing system RseC family protein [Prevotella sp.]
MENQIRHEGIIEKISGSHVQVRIVQTPACAGCRVASRCHTAESKEKLIDVTGVVDSSRWRVGQSVVVATRSGMAGKALLLGFGLPLLLMIAVFAASLVSGSSEGFAALMMLLSLIPYYLVLWLFRDSISQAISFTIEDM